MKKLLAILVLFSACSDKFVTLKQTAPRPEFLFRGDTINIREKDSLNVSGAGVLWLHTLAPAHQLNIVFNDSSRKVHFVYRGVELQDSWPVIVAGDSTGVFVRCDEPGMYSVDFYLTDLLGRTSSKQLVINCLANQKIKAALDVQFVDSSQSSNWVYRFDASRCVKNDGVITSYHFSVNGQPIVATYPIIGWVFHQNGLQTIDLFATDDLNQNSDTVTQKIMIP